jgi:RNA polymerase-binding transcription factor DksA
MARSHTVHYHSGEKTGGRDMSDKIEKIKAQLEARLHALHERLGEINETLRLPEDDDFEEQATEVDDDDLLEKMGRANRAEVRLIEEALRRIETGTYGKCVVCGTSIAERRLEALPEADTCMDCAQKKGRR